MSIPAGLLAALAEDNADHLRHAFKALSKSRTEHEFGARIDQLLEEFQFCKDGARYGTRDVAAANPSSPRRVECRAGKSIRRFIPIAGILLVVLCIVALWQDTSIQSHFDKVLTKSAEGLNVRKSPPLFRDGGDRSESVERAAGGLTAGAGQAQPHMPAVTPTAVERLVVTERPPIDRGQVAADPAFNPLRYYREKGVSAYRDRDLHLALVYFDLVVQQDPESSEGYIDRSIVHYRLGDMAKAFADIDRARLIDEAGASASP